MNTYMTEEEQVEIIRKWWTRWGNTTISVILAIMLGILGWRYWNQRELKIAANASVTYETLLQAVRQKDVTSIQAIANNIINEYGSSAYAAMAELILAKQAVTNNKLAVAEAHLKTAMQKLDDPALQQIARIRLARVQAAQKQYQVALKTLSKVNDKNFVSMIADVKGDVYLAMGNKDKARASYHAALNAATKAKLNEPLLTWKYQNLATKLEGHSTNLHNAKHQTKLQQAVA